MKTVAVYVTSLFLIAIGIEQTLPNCHVCNVPDINTSGIDATIGPGRCLVLICSCSQFERFNRQTCGHSDRQHPDVSEP